MSALSRSRGALPIEWKLLLVLREPEDAVVPYKGPIDRVVGIYFKRADPGMVTGQWRPEPKIEVCAILREENISGKEVGRENNIFGSVEEVAQFVRLKGFIKPRDVVLDQSNDYPYFQNLSFYNNIIPRPDWLDESVS